MDQRCVCLCAVPAPRRELFLVLVWLISTAEFFGSSSFDLPMRRHGPLGGPKPNLCLPVLFLGWRLDAFVLWDGKCMVEGLPFSFLWVFFVVFLVNASQDALFRKGFSGALGFIVEPNLYLGCFFITGHLKTDKRHYCKRQTNGKTIESGLNLSPKREVVSILEHLSCQFLVVTAIVSRTFSLLLYVLC